MCYVHELYEGSDYIFFCHISSIWSPNTSDDNLYISKKVLEKAAYNVYNQQTEIKKT